MKKSIVWGTLLIVACGMASAQWVWVDKNGNKVYSDRAPSIDIPEHDVVKRPVVRQQGATEIPPAPLPPSPNAAASSPNTPSSSAGALPPRNGQEGGEKHGGEKQSELEKAVEAKKKQAKEAELAKKRADEERMWKAKIKSCARAKQAYATYSSNVPIARVTADGGRDYIDPQTRAAELQRAQTIMAQDCQ